MFDRSKVIPLSVRKLKDNDIHVEITKAKLLIKVSNNPFVIKTTITAKIV